MGLLYSHYEANPTTNFKVNAVSGTLTKTFRKSFFKRFHMKSDMADYIFDETKPSLKNQRYCNSAEVVVLQVMLCGDNEFLAELIYKEDYDELFNVEIENDLKENGE